MIYDVYTPTRHLRLADEIAFRTYTWPQFRRLLGKVSALEMTAVHDFAYDLSQPISITERTEDVVFVLRKR